MALEFRVNIGSSTPVYRQIVDQVRAAVGNGNLRVGDQLPSVRALAELLVINPNTVSRAYGELVRYGVIESQPGRGLFVAERRQIFSSEERQRRLQAALDTFLSEVMLLDFSSTEIIDALRLKLRAFENPSDNKPLPPARSDEPVYKGPQRDKKTGVTASLPTLITRKKAETVKRGNS